MTTEFHADANSTVRCPGCSGFGAMRMIYGYPLEDDFSAQCIYGGDVCLPGAPTHYCERCGTSWCIADCPAIYFELPGSCSFCSNSLTAKDRFAFAVAYDELLSRDKSDLKLSDDAFRDAVFPICGECRAGIRGNLDDLAEQADQDDRQRVVAVRLAIGGFMLCLVLFAYATMAKY